MVICGEVYQVPLPGTGIFCHCNRQALSRLWPRDDADLRISDASAGPAEEQIRSFFTRRQHRGPVYLPEHVTEALTALVGQADS